MRRRGEGGRAKGEGLIFLDHKEPTGGRGGRREVGDEIKCAHYIPVTALG